MVFLLALFLVVPISTFVPCTYYVLLLVLSVIAAFHFVSLCLSHSGYLLDKICSILVLELACVLLRAGELEFYGALVVCCRILWRSPFLTIQSSQCCTCMLKDTFSVVLQGPSLSK